MRAIGKEIESLVEAYLINRGLKLVANNYSCQFGEIDLIMQDQEVLVFVEVRYRENIDYGDGAATVNKKKQSKIKKTAIYYLQQQNLYDKIFCRFDVVSVSGRSTEEIHWIKDAFWGRW